MSLMSASKSEELPNSEWKRWSCRGKLQGFPRLGALELSVSLVVVTCTLDTVVGATVDDHDPIWMALICSHIVDHVVASATP